MLYKPIKCKDLHQNSLNNHITVPLYVPFRAHFGPVWGLSPVQAYLHKGQVLRKREKHAKATALVALIHPSAPSEPLKTQLYCEKV